MADDFLSRLYALVEESVPRDKGIVESFIAKGDSARIPEDMGKAIDTCFHDSLFDLLYSYDVPVPPSPKHEWSNWFWADVSEEIRDFTVGEFKSVVQTRLWPDDAVVWKRASLFYGIIRLLALTFILTGGVVLMLGVLRHFLSI